MTALGIRITCLEDGAVEFGIVLDVGFIAVGAKPMARYLVQRHTHSR
jgi:hypothetical protein